MNDIKKAAYNLIRKYGWKSVFFHIWYKIALFIVVPISILCLSIYLISRNSINTEIRNNALNNCVQTLNASNAAFDELEKYYTLFCSNSYVTAFLSTEDLTIDSKDSSNTVGRIDELMRSYINTSAYIDSIYLYSQTGQFVLSSLNSNFLTNFSDTRWLDGFDQELYYFVLPEQDNVISVCYRISASSKHPGLLVFNINLKNFLSAIDSNASYTDSAVFLYDSNQTLLFGPGAAGPSADAIQADAFRATAIPQISILTSKDSICHAAQLEKHPLYLVRHVPLEQYNSNLNKLNFILLLSVLCSLLLTLLLSLFLSLNSYYSIAEIASSFYNIINDGEEQKNNEILDIHKNILSMNDGYNDLKADLSEKIAALKSAQSLALQNQISPHFVFNTLNMVNLMIMQITKKDCAPITVISLLSELLNESFRSKTFLVSVEQELEYLEKYLQIELIKYDNSFEVEWEVTPEVLESKAIKFSLQPIIENAINHGIRMMSDRKGKLRISVECKNGRLIYRIEDNGVGMPAHKLFQIQEKLKELTFTAQHIGLCNVNNRIKLIFGEEYGVSVTSDSAGTCVTLVTPNEPFEG